MLSEVEDNGLLQEESEDDFDWEEVEVPEHQAPHLEITLQAHPNASKGKGKDSNKKKGINHAERLVRIDCHKIHTVALIANAHIRNKWINDPLLHARLISLTPLHLQNAFGYIHKSRVPDQNQRGRMFERAIGDLTDWWANTFFEVIPEGHVRSHTFDEIQQKLEVRGLHIKNEDDPDAILELDTLEDILDEDAEVIRSEKSLMKHALMANGSRDVSAQLFTALCRGLGIPARLVVSVQSVPWQASIGKPKPKYSKKPKLKGKEYVDQNGGADTPSSSKTVDMGEGGQRLDGVPVPKSEKAKGKQKAKHVVKLRKTKSKGNTLGVPATSRLESPDPLTSPPVFWTEVFSRPDSKWFPVDPIRGIVNKRKAFDPTPSSNNAPTQPSIYSSIMGTVNTPTQRRVIPRTKVENRMVYVVAFEEDGYARDVTRRYAREYGAKVAKMQGGSNAPNMAGGGKGRREWWNRVVKSIERPYRLQRDDLEDQELDTAQLMEGMPTTMSGFKDHPLYILARHLKQTETLHVGTTELGKFRGEPVYPRSAVISLKTSENWMRSTGRMVKAGEQPMKMVKVRAGTVNKMRELEVLKDELKVAGQDGEGQSSSSSGGAEIMQGLYAFSQTEPYIPDPVVNGKVPKNNFGNIDLYVPSMLPKGAVHIPYKGVAKIARKLGFDYAEAVTGFEFKKRRAFPIVEGIVTATENEEAILEAFREAEQEAEEKARIKKEERVLKHWIKLIHGLRVRQRLQDQYGSKSKPDGNRKKTRATASTMPNRNMKMEQKVPSTSANDANGNDDEGHDGKENDDEMNMPRDDEYLSDTAGGFLAGADKVVHAFHLPKNTHVVLPGSSSLFPPSTAFTGVGNDSSSKKHAQTTDEQEEDEEEEERPDPAHFVTYDLDEMDVDIDMEASGGAGAGTGNASEEEQDDMEMEEIITTDNLSPLTPVVRRASKSNSKTQTPRLSSTRSTPGITGEPSTSSNDNNNINDVNVIVKDKIPMTMQELMDEQEAEAARQAELAREQGGVIVEEIGVPVQSGTPAVATATATRSQRPRRAAAARGKGKEKEKEKVTLTIPVSARGRKVSAAAAAAASGASTRGKRGAATKTAPRRSTKRKRYDESESESALESDDLGDEDELGDEAQDVEEDEEDEDEGEGEEIVEEDEHDDDIDEKSNPVAPAAATSNKSPRKRARAGSLNYSSGTTTKTKRGRTSVSVSTAALSTTRTRTTRTKTKTAPPLPTPSTTTTPPTATTTAPTASTSASASTRTLRPRPSKTPAQLAEEKKKEQAYRRAVAG